MDYMRENIAFLEKYQWLHNEKNIDFFKKKIYENIPDEWISEISMNNGISQRKKSGKFTESSLSQFVSEAKKLSLLTDVEEAEPNIRKKSINDKKSYELDAIVKFLSEYLVDLQIERVIDVGCGLGHLLNSLKGVGSITEFIGIDSNVSLCTKGQEKYENVNYINEKIDASNLPAIFKQTDKLTIIVSLHGCGNLQSSLCQLFTSVDPVYYPLLVTFPCCYHKSSIHELPLRDSCLSADLKHALGENEFRLTVPALRLACQKRNQEADLDHFMYRANLEEYFTLIGLNTNDLPRNLARKGTISEEVHFKKMLQFLHSSTDTPLKDDESEWKSFLQIRNRNSDKKNAAKLFLILQDHIQEVLESVLFSDMSSYLLENNCSVEIKPVFNSARSPRNTAIVAQR